MEEIAKYINGFFTQNAEIQRCFSGNVYWELAEEEGVVLPFCNFSIKEDPDRSKDRAGDFYVYVKIFDASLTSVAKCGDVVKWQVKENTQWHYDGGELEYVSTDLGKYGYYELKFKIRR